MKEKLGISFFSCRLHDTMAYLRTPNVILPKQPFDYFAVCNGIAFGIEAKSMHVPRFDLEHIPEHQKNGLKDIEFAGGKGFLLFSFREIKPVSCYACPINAFTQLEFRAKAEGRKSLPQDWIVEVSKEIRRIPRNGWNLEPLFLDIEQ